MFTLALFKLHVTSDIVNSIVLGMNRRSSIVLKQ